MPVEMSDETVIVADNDSMMRGLLRTVLEKPRRTLFLCGDGAEAVEIASQTLATLVLLDLRMPRMDGIEACKAIRELPRYDTVPIGMLTVFDAESPRRRAMRAGATFFLGKPFSRDQLIRVIKPLIDAQKQMIEVEQY